MNDLEAVKDWLDGETYLSTDIPDLRIVLRRSVDRMEKLERVAEAAKEHCRYVFSTNPNCSVEELREAIAALDGEDKP